MSNRFLSLVLLLAVTTETRLQAQERPNILWISCDDIGPHLGCYGQPDAITPALDALAERGVIYLHAYTTTPVCATNRSSIITGMYPTTIGTHYMRCEARLPANIRCFTEYLREAGYYCANNLKEDYNFSPPESAWDESSSNAHWRGRRTGQPFFAVFNLGLSHESKIWPRGEAHLRLSKDVTPDERRNPDKVTLPPYYPDTPEVRRDWANYHDNITQIDHQAGDILTQLQDDGLADDTIVFFWSDHGAGLPRAKRWLYDSGTHVPLIVHIPAKFRVVDQATPNTVSNELISFIDLAPTVLNLAGVTIPRHLPGRAFLGTNVSPRRQHVISVRDRMDNGYDMIRAVRDERYRYIRNYLPWKPYAQYLSYAEVNQTMKALRRAATNETLSKAARLFMADRKPIEELYDCVQDPHEINNLADSKNPEHERVLKRLRKALVEWEMESRDLGLIPEPIVRDQEAMLGDCAAILGEPAAREALRQVRQMIAPDISSGQRFDRGRAGVVSTDPVVRYWAINVITNVIEGDGPVADRNQAEIVRLLGTLVADKSAIVRVTAADALCRAGKMEKGLPVLLEGLTDNSRWVRLYSANYLSDLAPNDPCVISALEGIRETVDDAYVQWTTEYALHRIDGREIPNRWGTY